ncbi:hypothetical protein ACFE04_003554 [Oxalis oulophora]
MAPHHIVPAAYMLRNINNRFPSDGGRVPERGTRVFEYPRVNLNNNLTALLVENENVCRILTKAHLQLFGVETVAVDNGQDAINLIASGARFNLIIIDKFLGVPDGPEVTRRIRAMGVSCKIVGTSTWIFENNVDQEFLDAGVDVCVEKPMRPRWLADLVLELDGQ